jgi:endonuclease/exonuclease/phosphatase (EEP) superfamily protein YafD
VIIAGDLNLSPWSPYYARLVRETGLADIRKGFGLLPTWPTHLRPMMIPIDHCLVSPDISVSRVRTGEHIGSDHLPLIVDLMVAKGHTP